MKDKLWRFTDNSGSFEANQADKIKGLYFPLANESLMSSITPDLHGDIKTSQNSFLLTPVSRADLADSKVSRNFWIYINKDRVWSATGASKDLKQIKQDKFALQAGLLWQQITRENRKIGLRAEILSFVPAGCEPAEIMRVKITNISAKKIKFIPTAAIPIYGRGANNLRDHRHVTSLLQRIILHKFGVIVKPTLTFDESGHKPNKTLYSVLGWDEKFIPPQYMYPTQEMFCGDEGDLEAPSSVLKNMLPSKLMIQGKEAMAALRFPPLVLGPGKSKSYIIVMGIVEDKAKIQALINKFNSRHKIDDALKRTKDFWVSCSQKINLATGNPDFDNWFRWVSIQPVLRKIFGCSFLPDFDYGKGGRGWRDLWQDCLGLILNNPKPVREMLINNFSGVRIDGSNATIIGKKEGEFISDRNNISRVWMDHGVWPQLTLDLYINETGDFDILFEGASYFRDHQINRSQDIDFNWDNSGGNKLKTSSGKIYQGTILEHLLVQNLVQFFNVGSHNHVRLEGADWNDGLDMACENGESVAFSAMYAQNLLWLAQILEKIGRPHIIVVKELKILLSKINYNDVGAKHKILDEYFNKTKLAVSGEKIKINASRLADDLNSKSEWMMNHIRKQEWQKEGFFNGYYDNAGKRVEGKNNNLVRMMLASQVFAIMSGVAQIWQMDKILRSVKKYLFDKQVKGYHLNTDFSRGQFKTSGGILPKAGRQEQSGLGRAFSFVYGDKENGAFFNHMIVMFANALYKRGYVKEGWQALGAIYNMALDTKKSKIYPCLPEYFNLEGRGMYSYLTGSASWFVLTMLIQVFGIKGQSGDLLIEPKLAAEQFNGISKLSINRMFAGRKLRINLSNPHKLEYPGYKIKKATLNSRRLSSQHTGAIVIPRKIIANLTAGKINTLDIELG